MTANPAARRLSAAFRAASRERDRVARYWSDPVLFVEECIRLPEGEHLAPYQAEMMRRLVTDMRVCGRGPRGYGKSAENALIVIWFAITREMAGTTWKCVTTAGSWSQLEDYLWPEIQTWVSRIRWDVLGIEPWRRDREVLTLGIHLEHGSALAANPKVSARIEGGHAEQFLYVFDEAKLIPGTTWDSAEGSASSTTGRRELRWLAQSSGGDADGRFYDISTGQVEGWWPRHVTKDEAIAAGRMNPEWAERMARIWGESSAPYQNHVLGNFATTGGASSVVRLSDVERAVERWRAWDKAGRPGEWPQTALSVDVGTGNIDRDPACIARRNGNVIAAVELLRFAEKFPEMQLAGQVRARLVSGGGYAIVDGIGQGAGVISRLRESAGLDVRAFIASGGSTARDRSGLFGFRNQRAEVWWQMREELADSESEVALPPDPILMRELIEPGWKMTSNSLIQIEEKSEIAARLSKLESRRGEGGSTNRADAVVMAYWQSESDDETSAITSVRVRRVRSRWAA